jgi:dTDP-4-amino-4,6-dideoxygalactose transaminase
MKVYVPVRYSYLSQQFADCPELWDELKRFVATGDFTLGQPLTQFEKSFAELIGTKYAIGVNSGTDAIKLSLRALGVKPGDEVITAANTFVATVGAIAEIGAIPIFVDCNDNFCMDVSLVEASITERTRAIVPVHFTGYMTRMDELVVLANKFGIPIVEDACQSILADISGKKAGTWGATGAFSLHPLKNLNVWSDGGVIVTDDSEVDHDLRLLRNHGLVDRDHVEVLGYNSRLDTFQAVVGNWLLPQAKQISDLRISNARYLDEKLKLVDGITIPNRPADMRVVFHLYSVFAKNRNNLLKHCISKGIEAKVHYPVPIYRQQALARISGGLRFPVSDRLAADSISFPCDQHLEIDQLDEIISTVIEFYKN